MNRTALNRAALNGGAARSMVMVSFFTVASAATRKQRSISLLRLASSAVAPAFSRAIALFRLPGAVVSGLRWRILARTTIAGAEAKVFRLRLALLAFITQAPTWPGASSVRIYLREFLAVASNAPTMSRKIYLAKAAHATALPQLSRFLLLARLATTATSSIRWRHLTRSLACVAPGAASQAHVRDIRRVVLAATKTIRLRLMTRPFFVASLAQALRRRLITRPLATTTTPRPFRRRTWLYRATVVVGSKAAMFHATFKEMVSSAMVSIALARQRISQALFHPRVTINRKENK